MYIRNSNFHEHKPGDFANPPRDHGSSTYSWMRHDANAERAAMEKQAQAYEQQLKALAAATDKVLGLEAQ